MFRIFFDSTATKLRFKLSPLGSNYEFFSPFLSSSSYFVLLFSSFYGAPGREWCRGCKNRRRVVIEGARAWGCFYEKGEWCEFTARFEKPTLNAELYPRFHLIDPLSITYKNVFFISLSLRDRWNIPNTLRIHSFPEMYSFCVEYNVVAFSFFFFLRWTRNSIVVSLHWFCYCVEHGLIIERRNIPAFLLDWFSFHSSQRCTFYFLFSREKFWIL